MRRRRRRLVSMPHVALASSRREQLFGEWLIIPISKAKGGGRKWGLDIPLFHLCTPSELLLLLLPLLPLGSAFVSPPRLYLRSCFTPRTPPPFPSSAPLPPSPSFVPNLKIISSQIHAAKKLLTRVQLGKACRWRDRVRSDTCHFGGMRLLSGLTFDCADLSAKRLRLARARGCAV